MGINETNRTVRQNVQVRYSAVLGGLYVSNPVSEAILDAAKAEIGPDLWKMGFDGLSEGSTSSRARQLVNTPEFVFAGNGLSGQIFSVMIKEVESAGGSKSLYLNIGLKDRKTAMTFWISIPLANAGAQMLVRKLHSVAYDAWVSLNVFGTFGKKPGAERAFGNHGAALQLSDGQEVPCVENDLEAQRAAQEQRLNAAGVELDTAALRTVKDSINLRYHAGLIDEIVLRFVAEKEAAPASQPA